MRAIISATIMISVLGLLGACATPRPVVTLDPVGPEPEAVRMRHVPDGVLVVYTALQTEKLGCCDDYIESRSAYDVLTPAGVVVKHVDNAQGVGNDGPVVVPLASGQYVVQALARNAVKVAVPVLIVRGQVTQIRLDGSELENHAVGTPDELVRLPDGSVVGWRATEAMAVN